jgi:hypothetical protein
MARKSMTRKTAKRKATSSKAAGAAKLDLFKEHSDEYAMPRQPALVVVKPAKYLTITGQGEPGSAPFQAKLMGLYGAAFTIKMTSKSAGRDYKVCPLESLWWGVNQGDFWNQPRDKWNWKLLIRTPDFIGKSSLAEAIATLQAKNKGPEVAEVRLEKIGEGRCVQMLHVGPYDQEPETITRMAAFASENGLAFHGTHHEIYLSDPRRVAPERLRTILRQPVRRNPR